MAKRATPEGAVLRDCLALLRMMGIWHWRNNTGAVSTPSGGFIRFGAKGSADILALRNGRFIAIECKSPKGKPTPEQSAWGQSVKANGGYWWCVSSAAELAAALSDDVQPLPATQHKEPTK